MAKEIFEGVFQVGREREVATKGDAVFEDERVVSEGGERFRIWDPARSKIAAAIKKGLKRFPVKKGTKVLYLGAANGYTASFLSDVIGEEGAIYAIEFSSRSVRDLATASRKKTNISVVFGDARLPQTWLGRTERADVIFSDVAQPDQSEILIRVAEVALKSKGYAMIAIKARSIDVTKPPRVVYEQQRRILEKRFEVLQMVELDPYEKAHALFLLRLR